MGFFEERERESNERERGFCEFRLIRSFFLMNLRDV